MTLLSEIGEQPAVAAGLLDRAPAITRVAAALRGREIEHVVIAARGTSDHAAVYAQYLFGVRLGLPVGLATPSIVSLYGAPLRFGRALVIGISQSGASPDIVGVVAAAHDQGVPTIALTNEPGSALAAAADHVIDLGAGPELAVAATKTYTAELLALAILAAALGSGDDPRIADPGLGQVPAALERALGAEDDARAVAADLAGHDACVVVGRGFEYATARELALKLKELAQVVADPYSAADFRHGPMALVSAGFPVLAIATAGRAAADMDALIARLRDDLGADVVVLTDRPGGGTGGLGPGGPGSGDGDGRRSLAVPAGLPEHLVPIASIVPGQLLAHHLALARGLDSERPRNLTKVTRTR
jgi:glutamine---fructose-6-phosphate transaminase (isomerizing)